MNIQVGQHIVKILNSNPINEKEIDISKCYFEFDEEITDNYVKEAYFTLNNHTYKQIIVNNECDIPYEVLTQKGELEIGVVAYLVENDEEIKRYNPSPDYFKTWKGSLKDADNSEPITPSDKEQIEQQLLEISTKVDDIEYDLTGYVKDTDYARSTKAGVIKVNTMYGLGVNSYDGILKGVGTDYDGYITSGVSMVISKGTLENVITGKGLTTKSYVDSVVGDISSVIDSINGEVI